MHAGLILTISHNLLNISIQVPDTDNSRAILTANTIYGALRGLESFSQLVKFDYENESYMIRQAPWLIKDSPRFPHRGILLDTSRHFQPLWVGRWVWMCLSTEIAGYLNRYICNVYYVCQRDPL